MYIKEHVFVWTVKSIFGHHEHLGLWFPQTTKFASFFLFHLSFLNQWCCYFIQLIIFAEQVSNILQFPSVYNFPLHLHTYFLIYTDDKILPNTFVLKSCLILVACNSEFFWLSIWWMTYSNALHLESNLKHRVFHIRCKVWKLGNITWEYILAYIPQF